MLMHQKIVEISQRAYESLFSKESTSPCPAFVQEIQELSVDYMAKVIYEYRSNILTIYNHIAAPGRLLHYGHSCPTPVFIQCLNYSLYIRECVPELMGLVRQGHDRGEDKGQNRKRRLEEDQTEQMCGNGRVRTKSEHDERRLDCLKASAATASAHSQRLNLSAEGAVSPNGFGRYHSFDVCPTTDGSHMAIITRNQKKIGGGLQNHAGSVRFGLAVQNKPAHINLSKEQFYSKRNIKESLQALCFWSRVLLHR